MDDVYPYTAKINSDIRRNKVEASFVSTKGKDLLKNLKLYHSSTNNGFNITADIAYQVESTGVAEPVVHVLDHLLLLFLGHIFVLVFLEVRVSFNSNIVVQVVCLEGIRIIHFVIHLLLQEFEVVLLEILVKSDAVDEVPVAHTSHNRHDIDGVPIILHLKMIGDKAVIFKAHCQHTLIW